ncbi:MAG: restriction endonuclease [Patescibacteria group bacterium]
MQDKILIIKATGEREAFNPLKLRYSLEKAKAAPEIIERILTHIKMELKEGMTTRDIYSHAFNLLERESKPIALRYSLRNAVIEMGPTGFPFEQLIAEIMCVKGFETRTDFTAKGECVEHEIDVVAWNENRLIMIEAKFHNEFGIKSDLKTALYVKARWGDLEEKEFDTFGQKRKLDEGWLITNTKFTEQAIRYALCRNMKLIGWNFPQKGNLQDLIEDTGLHPITALKSISSSHKKALMEAGIIHVKQFTENLDVAKQCNIPSDKVEQAVLEIKQILN